MKTLALLGKKYHDEIIFVNDTVVGETNTCSSILKKDGGMFNLLEVDFENMWRLSWESRGSKKAYIISNLKNSNRTSYVHDEETATHEGFFIESINNNADWAHISYLDDYECFVDFVNLRIPFSVDFCTASPRNQFLDIMKKAEIVFDSRERKSLYKEILIDTNIILHDEYGVEIIKNGETISKIHNKPINNLMVNGAGDIFAGNFIKYYDFEDATGASFKSMKETTSLLMKRNK